jgi:hypothetical protein
VLDPLSNSQRIAKPVDNSDHGYLSVDNWARHRI